MKKLNKVNVSDSIALNFNPPKPGDICGSCAVPGNSTSGKYAEVRAINHDEF